MSTLGELAEFEHLETRYQAAGERYARWQTALERAKASRELVYTTRNGAPLLDSAELIRELREERCNASTPDLP
jgi:hypothetical protein